MKKSFVAILIMGMFVLSACGDVKIPESIPDDTTSTITDEQLLTEGEVLKLESASPSASATLLENASCQTLQQERDNLSEAITLAQEELKTCKAEKEKLVTSTVSASVTDARLKSLEPILKKYIAEGKKAEFAFDLCGGIGRVTQELWYADFQKALESEKIMFKAMSRPLIPGDFYSVCFSTEGKMAVFLGAANQSISEFHIVKYDFNAKTAQEAYLINGTCENCPNQFGRRVGPAIVLFNKNGARITEFNYFYDMNVIQQK